MRKIYKRLPILPLIQLNQSPRVFLQLVLTLKIYRFSTKTTGGWDSVTIPFFKQLAELAANQTNSDRNQKLNQLMTSLSMSLQIENANMLAERYISTAA